MTNIRTPYRAIISFPLGAANDEEAMALAGRYANAIKSPSGFVQGHLELLGETPTMSMAINRVVLGNIPALLSQIPDALGHLREDSRGLQG